MTEGEPTSFMENLTDVSLLSLEDLLASTPSAASLVRLDDLQQTLETTRFVVLKVVALIIIIAGVFGNVINILILSKRSMKSSTSYYLCALAVYDILYLISALTMTFVHYKEIRDNGLYFRYKNICGRALTDTWSNTGVWLTVTFTVERYAGVCYPMKGKAWCTTKKAKRVILGVCLCSAALTFPEFFEFKVVATEVRANVTQLKRIPSEFGNSRFCHVYNHLNQALFAFIPLVFLTIFNVLLIRTVVGAARIRRRLTIKLSDPSNYDRQERNRRKEQAISVMLISVVVVFLLCQLPQSIQKLYAIYLESYGLMTEEKVIRLMIQGNYFNLLVIINCSVNFVLYSACSYEFRRTFRQLGVGCYRRTSTAASRDIPDQNRGSQI